MTYAETAQRLASRFYDQTRDDGTEIACFRDENADDREALLSMTLAANQSGIDADDAYQMVWDALQQIADTEPNDITDTDRDGLVDIYTHSLMRWLARNWSLADEMHDEYGQWPDTMNDIAMQAQDYAYGLVLQAIAAHWPDDENDDTDE